MSPQVRSLFSLCSLVTGPLSLLSLFSRHLRSSLFSLSRSLSLSRARALSLPLKYDFEVKEESLWHRAALLGLKLLVY